MQFVSFDFLALNDIHIACFLLGIACMLLILLAMATHSSSCSGLECNTIMVPA